MYADGVNRSPSTGLGGIRLAGIEGWLSRVAEARPTHRCAQGKSGVVVNVCYKRIEPVSTINSYEKVERSMSATDIVYPRKELGMGFTSGAPTTSLPSLSRPQIARTDASTSSPRS